MGVFEAPLFKSRDGPVGGVQEHRRAGQPGAVDVGEPAQQLHDLAVFQAVLTDGLDGRFVHFFLEDGLLGERRDGATNQQQQDDEDLAIGVLQHDKSPLSF